MLFKWRYERDLEEQKRREKVNTPSSSYRSLTIHSCLSQEESLYRKAATAKSFHMFVNSDPGEVIDTLEEDIKYKLQVSRRVILKTWTIMFECSWIQQPLYTSVKIIAHCLVGPTKYVCELVGSYA